MPLICPATCLGTTLILSADRCRAGCATRPAAPFFTWASQVGHAPFLGRNVVASSNDTRQTLARASPRALEIEKKSQPNCNPLMSRLGSGGRMIRTGVLIPLPPGPLALSAEQQGGFRPIAQGQNSILSCVCGTGFQHADSSGRRMCRPPLYGGSRRTTAGYWEADRRPSSVVVPSSHVLWDPGGPAGTAHDQWSAHPPTAVHPSACFCNQTKLIVNAWVVPPSTGLLGRAGGRNVTLVPHLPLCMSVANSTTSGRVCHQTSDLSQVHQTD